MTTDEKLTRILDYLHSEEHEANRYAAKCTGLRDQYRGNYYRTRANAMRNAIDAIRTEFPELPY